ncbi:uncharacterized protein Z520_09205 [Fonsecaea multimorphosa CBS 102226]|uniref:Uncharacterized protein n=1 Tax=Fonsecaea multimorphosa CBS 102226 TaxID=1442371 RepID=A0A0D2ICN9_9EURO|nr:uncharacterized protein Z520_09205 [Fonsecaea multimorphosa CBS 102226]KIX94896.1 hypothetical protein Z520_09205 [Fonsecaea multimorphosa CBS 102226]OAL20787.1 hypothetical protein AYO22_08557 [Fonsecaea multimorphosa]
MATTTTWDAIVFVVTYACAVFLTIVDAQSCGNMTTTVSVVKTITETVPWISGPLTVTMTESIVDGFNFTHVSGTTFPGVIPAIATVTDTITVGNDTSAQSTSVVESPRSGSAITLTSTTKFTSYVNNTASATVPAVSSGASGNFTRASVPGSLTLTFPITTASPACAFGLPNGTCGGGSFISATEPSTLNLTSTLTITSTTHLDTITSVALPTTAVNTPRPFFVNSTFETSFPSTALPLSSAMSVPTSASDSITVNHTGSSTSTRTTTTLTTVTLSKTSAAVSAINSTLDSDTLMLATTTTTSTVEPIVSVLSIASSFLGNASSVIATKTVGTTTTATPLETVLSAASSILGEATSEIASKTAGADITTTTVYTTIEATETASSSGMTFTETVSVYVDTTTTSVVVDNTGAAIDLSSTTTISSMDSATTILPSMTTVGVPLSSVVMASESLNASTFTTPSNESISLPVVSASSASGFQASASISLYTPTMTGAASSLRAPRVFGLVARFLMVLDLVKPQTLVRAAVPGLPQPEPETAPLPPSLTITPNVSASVSVSFTTLPCNCTAYLNETASILGAANSTIWLTTTVQRTLTVITTLTTQVPGAHPANSSSTAIPATATVLPAPAPAPTVVSGTSSLTEKPSTTDVVGVTITTPASLVGNITITLGTPNTTIIPAVESMPVPVHTTAMSIPFPNSTTISMANVNASIANATTMTVNSSTTVHPTVTSFFPSSHVTNNPTGIETRTTRTTFTATPSTVTTSSSSEVTRLTVHTVTALLLVAVTAWFVL